MVDRFGYANNGRIVAEFTTDGTLITHCSAAEYTEMADRSTAVDVRAQLRLLAVIAELRGACGQ